MLQALIGEFVDMTKATENPVPGDKVEELVAEIDTVLMIDALLVLRRFGINAFVICTTAV